MTDPTPEQRQRMRELRAQVWANRYGPRRSSPRRAPAVVPGWMWDMLTERDRPWFTAAREAGLIVRAGEQ